MARDNYQSTLELPSIRCFARVGWGEQERSSPQPICLRVRIRFKTPPAATRTDELADTLDYAALVATLQGVCSSRQYRLLERLAHDVYQAIQPSLPDGADLWVQVAKEHPPLAALKESAYFGLGDPT